MEGAPAEAEPPPGPDDWYAFKLGPFPGMERGEKKAPCVYSALAPAAPSGSVPRACTVVVERSRDAEGLAELVRRLPAGAVLHCEPVLARAGRSKGFDTRALPRQVLTARANLAAALAWGMPLEVPPESVAELRLAGAELWWAAPWRFWENEARLTVELSGAVQGERDLMLLGNGGQEFGFALFDEPGGHARMTELSFEEDFEAARFVPCVALNYMEEPEFAVEAMGDDTGVPLLPSPLRLKEGELGSLETARDAALLLALTRALRELNPQRLEARAEAGVGDARVQVHVRAPSPLPLPPLLESPLELLGLL